MNAAYAGRSRFVLTETNSGGHVHSSNSCRKRSRPPPFIHRRPDLPGKIKRAGRGYLLAREAGTGADAEEITRIITCGCAARYAGHGGGARGAGCDRTGRRTLS